MSKKKIGVSKTQPKGEARPLGTPRTKTRQSSDPLVATPPAKVLDMPSAPIIDSLSVNQSGEPTTSGDRIMDITLVRSDEKRRSTSVVYTGVGLKHSVKFSKTAFANGGAPTSFVLSFPEGILAEPAKPRAAMTAEERKAARDAAPKLTLAEKIAKRQKSLDALKAKADAQAQAANQPSL